jgi:hypothetical protein
MPDKPNEFKYLDGYAAQVFAPASIVFELSL